MKFIHRIRARVQLFALAFLVVALALVVGCPKLPPVSGCQPHAMACRGDLPHVCSASQRWEPAGDTTCARVGGACAINDAGAAFCTPLVDGGSDASD